MTEIKNSIESFNIIVIQTEERISELEDRLFEIIHSEEQKEKKRIKKGEHSLCELWDPLKETIYALLKSQKKNGRKLI